MRLNKSHIKTKGLFLGSLVLLCMIVGCLAGCKAQKEIKKEQPQIAQECIDTIRNAASFLDNEKRIFDLGNKIYFLLEGEWTLDKFINGSVAPQYAEMPEMNLKYKNFTLLMSNAKSKHTYIAKNSDSILSKGEWQLSFEEVNGHYYSYLTFTTSKSPGEDYTIHFSINKQNIVMQLNLGKLGQSFRTGGYTINLMKEI